MVRTAVGNVPNDFEYVFGYVSGLNEVPWTAAEFSKYQGRRITRIYQGAGTYPGLDGFDEIDVESGACTPQSAADLVAQRVTGGHQWTGIYGTRSTIEATAALIQAKGADVWNGHVYCRLADWNLNETEAAAVVGTHIGGMTCVAVQWASPTSNPHTLLPGTGLTLSQAAADLNVVDATLIPGVGFGAGGSPVGPPPQVTTEGIVVYGDPLTSRTVHSNDNGSTWQY